MLKDSEHFLCVLWTYTSLSPDLLSAISFTTTSS